MTVKGTRARRQSQASLHCQYAPAMCHLRRVGDSKAEGRPEADLLKQLLNSQDSSFCSGSAVVSLVEHAYFRLM